MYKYKLDQKVGSGAFGDVFIARHIETNDLVAVKLMKQAYNDWNECLELREIKSLLKLKHQNIIALKEVFQTEGKLCLVFDYAESNLFERYLKPGHTHHLTEPQIKSITRQLSQALLYTHKNGFFHRDLKPQNILIIQSEYKLCDFGLARQIRSLPPYTAYVSTRWYRAPELVMRMTNYNSPVDIFALGCILAELYIGGPLFPGGNEADQLAKIFGVMGTPLQGGWPEMYKWAAQKKIKIPEVEGKGLDKVVVGASPQAIDLLTSMLQVNPKNRITASNILKHPYLSDTTYIPRQIPITKNDNQSKKHRKKHSSKPVHTQAASLHNFVNEYIDEPKDHKHEETNDTHNVDTMSKTEDLELSGIIRQMEAKNQRKKTMKTEVLIKSSARYSHTELGEEPEQQDKKEPACFPQTDPKPQTKLLTKQPLSKAWSSVASLDAEEFRATGGMQGRLLKKKNLLSDPNNEYYQTNTRQSHQAEIKKREFRGRKLVSIEKSKEKDRIKGEKKSEDRGSSSSSSESLQFLKYRFEPSKQAPQEPTPKKMLSQLKVPVLSSRKI